MSNELLTGLPILRSSYEHLTKSERRIAAYITENSRDIMEQTISEIAANTKSSEITVSRFCKKLGFSGLQSLKISLAGEMFASEENIYQEIQPEDTPKEVAQKLFQNITDGLQDTLQLLDFNAVAEAVSILRQAGRIAVYGFGNSATVCRDIEARFLRFSRPVQAYSDSHQQVTSAALLTPQDAVIAVSHTGSSIELLQSVEIAKKSGAKLIAITSYAHSPLAKAADVVLYGMGREVRYRSEAVASRFVHMAIADLLYTELARADHDTYMENMQKMRIVIAEKRL